MILLDTQAIIWLTTDNPAVGKESLAIYARALETSELFVNAISFWEMAMLVGKGRLTFDKSPVQYRIAIIDAGFQELPVTSEIGILAAELDLDGSLADRLIVATAIVHGATLMAADRALLRWRHRLPRQDASK